MKLASQKLGFVVASAALVLAGCTKKPMRPDPQSTILGPIGGGGTGSDISRPVDTGFNPEGTGLGPRQGGFDPSGQDREALKGNTVYFDFDRFEIKPAERAKLQAAKAYLDQNPTYRLLLEGHCDWRGTAEYNLGLGDRRANSVKRYLLTLGVAADRLETVSKGSLEAAKNADAATMEKDRRVDLIVTAPKAAAAAPL